MPSIYIDLTNIDREVSAQIGAATNQSAPPTGSPNREELGLCQHGRRLACTLKASWFDAGVSEGNKKRPAISEMRMAADPLP